ncbi:SDR family oxidoreductase [Sphingomonas sp.]|uniref:SDR family oxidoreductase n=1 Tax=Sphingomonas sp. TaxID=28214 RepID=UPI003D6C81C1
MGRVDGKICLVTGAAMGLGKAEAEALAAEGGTVILCDIDESAGQAAATAIGHGAVFMRLDVCDEQQWQDVIARILARFGKLDVLVNNAGVIDMADIEACTLESWRRINAVSVEGTFLGVKHALPAMRQSGGGSIINTSSSAALQGVPPVPAYSAAKAAVAAMTRTIAVHCMQKGDAIRCNVIHPHNVDTPMMRAMFEQFLADVPLDQRPELEGAPSTSVAKTVLFLASDESSDLNGTSINLDRGAICVPAG